MEKVLLQNLNMYPLNKAILTDDVCTEYFLRIFYVPLYYSKWATLHQRQQPICAVDSEEAYDEVNELPFYQSVRNEANIPNQQYSGLEATDALSSPAWTRWFDG